MILQSTLKLCINLRLHADGHIVGKENVYVSIYESNSIDSTPDLLSQFNTTLTNLQIPHTLLSENTNNRWWPYATAPERISYLAKARNRALLPLHHSSLPIHPTKIIFLNDIIYRYQDILRLIDTQVDGEGDYDLACAMDFGASGLYDTWVSRDVCGVPFRAFWPYVKDGESVRRMKRGEAFEVASCWNGVVVMKAGPFLPNKGGKKEKRGWKMIDSRESDRSLFHSGNLTDVLNL